MAAAGNVSRVAETAWIELLAGDSVLGREAIRRQADALREGLLGESPCLVERLVVSQIVGTWLELQFARLDAAEPDASLAQAKLRLRRLESAQRRHDTALKSLTQIRKILPQPQAGPPRLHVFHPDATDTGT